VKENNLKIDLRDWTLGGKDKQFFYFYLPETTVQTYLLRDFDQNLYPAPKYSLDDIFIPKFVLEDYINRKQVQLNRIDSDDYREETLKLTPTKEKKSSGMKWADAVKEVLEQTLEITANEVIEKLTHYPDYRSYDKDKDELHWGSEMNNPIKKKTIENKISTIKKELRPTNQSHTLP
jgi:hypothetical protein